MTDPDEELLALLLLCWEDDFQRGGGDTSASELAKDHPHIIDELSRRIQLLKDIVWLDAPLLDDDFTDLPRSTSPYLSKTLAGRYRLDELIAVGGFAEVFRAYDTELQRTVAVKLPKSSRLQSKEAFQAEARRFAQLSHEGIVPIFDVGIDGDACFLVTEYIKGGSLAKKLVEAAIQPGDVIRWAMEIGEALEYAHLHGIIHLDIKPANLLFDNRGRARLTDFGISRSPDDEDDFFGSMGTLLYMSPEQLEGKPTDYRSDIYSLAIVIHEALSGAPPYSSTLTHDLHRDIASASISLAKTLPAGVQRVFSKALSRSPHERHTSATEFSAALRKAWDDGTRPIRWPWVVAVTLLLCVGAVAFTTTMRPRVANTAQPSVQQLLAVAKTNMLHEQYAEAETGFSQVLKIAPFNVDALKGRGFCHMNLNMLKEAVADLTTADKISPHDPALLKLRASAYVALRDYPKATADLEAALKLMPDAREIQEKLASVRAMQSPEQISDVSVQATLARRITVVFDRNTLLKTLEIISRDVGVPITLLIDDLQRDGITKNQNVALAEHDKTADDILRTTLQTADPQGRLVYVIRTEDGKDTIVVTTRAAAKARGDKLPAGF